MSAPGVNRPSEPGVPQPLPPSDPSKPPTTPPPGDSKPSQGTQDAQGTQVPADKAPPPPPKDSKDDAGLMEHLADALSGMVTDPEAQAKVAEGLRSIERTFNDVFASVMDNVKDQEDAQAKKAEEQQDKFFKNEAKQNSREALKDALATVDQKRNTQGVRDQWQNLMGGGRPQAQQGNNAKQTQTQPQQTFKGPAQDLKEAFPKPQLAKAEAGPQAQVATTPDQKNQQVKEAQDQLQLFAQAYRSLPEGDPKKDLLKGMLNELAGQVKQFEKPDGKQPDPALSNKIASMLGDKVASKTKDAKETTEEVKKGEEAKIGGQVADSSTTVGAPKGKQGQSGQGDQSGQGKEGSTPDLTFKESIGVLVTNIGMNRLDKAGKDSLLGAQCKAAVRQMENGAVACATARAVRMTYGQDGDEQGSGRGESQDRGVDFGMLDQDGQLAAAGYKVDAAAAGLGGAYGIRTADGKLVPMWAAAYGGDRGDDRGIGEEARKAAQGYGKFRAFIAASTLSGASAAQTGQIQFAHRC